MDEVTVADESDSALVSGNLAATLAQKTMDVWKRLFDNTDQNKTPRAGKHEKNADCASVVVTCSSTSSNSGSSLSLPELVLAEQPKHAIENEEENSCYGGSSAGDLLTDELRERQEQEEIQAMERDEEGSAARLWTDIASDLQSVLTFGLDSQQMPNRQQLKEHSKDEEDDDSDAIDLLYGFYCAEDEESKEITRMDLFFQLVHDHSVDDSPLLLSLAHLRWELQQENQQLEGKSRAKISVSINYEEKKDDEDKEHNATTDKFSNVELHHLESHTNAIHDVASFLVDASRPYHSKLACLNVLLVEHHQPTNAFHSVYECHNHDADESMLRTVLAFCVAPHSEEMALQQVGRQHSDALLLLLWELRALCLYLPTTVSYKEEEVSPPTQSSKPRQWQRFARLSRFCTRPEQRQDSTMRWENAREYLFATHAALLPDLDILHAAYDAGGINNVVVLASVGYLRIETRPDVDLDFYQRDIFYHKHHEAIRHVATYFMDFAVQNSAKVACLQCLDVEFTSSEQRQDFDGSVSGLLRQVYSTTDTSSGNLLFYQKALRFCTDPTAYTESFLIRDDDRYSAFMFLLWELRAVCLNIWQIQEERHERAMATVATVADSIIEGALTIEAGFFHGSAAVTAGIDAGSRFIISRTTPSQSTWLQTDRKTSVVTLTYSNSFRRATDMARYAIAATVSAIKDVSSHHAFSTAKGCSRWMTPRNPGHRVAIEATGHVALATLGAVSVVGEAVVSCTDDIAQSVASATRSLVSHKYGLTAGQVVEDFGKTAGNVLRIERNVTLLTSQTAARTVKLMARHTSKAHVRQKRKPGVDADTENIDEGTESQIDSDESGPSPQEFSGDSCESGDCIPVSASNPKQLTSNTLINAITEDATKVL